MGFMDKAKQMADQAQKKIEETQKQFNEGQAAKAGPGAGGGEVTYDSSGRPIPAAPPVDDPARAPGVAQPQPPAAVDGPETASAGAVVPEGAATAPEGVEEEPVPPPAPPKEGMNATPDPFKPIQ